MVGAISRLEKVDLEGTLLTLPQTREIFSLVAERGTSRLRRIYLGACTSVNSVSEELRERAKANRLVSLKYYWQTC